MTKAELRRALDNDGGDETEDVQIYVLDTEGTGQYAYYDIGKVTVVGPVGPHAETGTIIEIGEIRCYG